MQLYNGNGLPNSEGYVIVCIVYENPEGEHKPGGAAFCWDGNSTFNEGAAADKQVIPNRQSTILVISKLLT